MVIDSQVNVTVQIVLNPKGQPVVPKTNYNVPQDGLIQFKNTTGEAVQVKLQDGAFLHDHFVLPANSSVIKRVLAAPNAQTTFTVNPSGDVGDGDPQITVDGPGGN